ncbi:hypothetical protein D3C85_1823110 [compost metagenome]
MREPFLPHFKYRLGIGYIIHNGPHYLPDAFQLVQVRTALQKRSQPPPVRGGVDNIFIYI